MVENLHQIKKELIEQINSTFPEDKKQLAIEQINSMGDEQFIEFLKQNNMLDEKELSEKTEKTPQCIFCSIVKKHTSSFLIDENKAACAVLEINPISKGHVIIIPKEHIDKSGKIPQLVFSLAKKISKKIQSKLKPKEIKISSSNVFGHTIVNVLPIYSKENLESQRYQAKKEDLESLQKLLKIKIKKKIVKPKKPEDKEKIESFMRLPRRIP